MIVKRLSLPGGCCCCRCWPPGRMGAAVVVGAACGLTPTF